MSVCQFNKQTVFMTRKRRVKKICLTYISGRSHTTDNRWSCLVVSSYHLLFSLFSFHPIKHQPVTDDFKRSFITMNVTLPAIIRTSVSESAASFVTCPFVPSETGLFHINRGVAAILYGAKVPIKNSTPRQYRL